MITFGLTGGIASGKSTATRTFLKHGIPMVDADVIARQVVEIETPGWGMIRAMFGHEYLNEDESINRTKLGELVFSDKSAMYKLNAIMTPLIEIESYRQLASFHEQGYNIVGYDAAIIIENGNADKYRPLVVVGCPKETQLQRLMDRNGFSEKVAMARIESQMTFEAKKKFADHIIDTSGTIEWSVEQTENIIRILKNDAA